jgi:hypothetical protein
MPKDLANAFKAIPPEFTISFPVPDFSIYIEKTRPQKSISAMKRASAISRSNNIKEAILH